MEGLRAMEKEQLIPIILSTTPFLNRQKEITKFLGIPVDGTRSEMIKKLKKKGFSATPTFGDFVLEGKFKGNDVYLYMFDYKDKVFSVYVRDKKPISEADIKERYHSICRKFKYSSHYISILNFKIPCGENLSYEMQENKKKYSATFYQAISKIDIDKVKEETKSIISKTTKQIENLEEIDKECENFILGYALDSLEKKSVKVRIVELDEEYYITISFDNRYNMPELSLS